ncbi:MAG TPA: PilZ domain-containing protein [Candidatus Dormibacteraeota bacterium]|nr:PilZ domain-containing protein [Candidatus Dormibacteraeota bacterium]
MDQEPRGLRFAFNADAVISPQNSPDTHTPARVTELSLRGCFLQTAASFAEQQVVLVKIFYLDEFFETEAGVLYVQPRGLGLEFRETKPHFRAVLQKWILAALHSQPDAS